MKKFIFSAKGRVLLSILVFMIVCCPVLLLSYSAGEQEEPETDLRYQTDMYYEYLSNMKYEVVSSDNYIVSDKYISRIKPNTTIEDFVSGLSNSNVKITLDDIEVTDGIVKTGMVLNFNDQTYTLIVIGDVNKDGLLNYIDTSMIINNSKITELDEVSKIASDINNDNLINKEDVTSSINYIFEGKLDKDEISKVSKPSLEIVNGTKDKYDWYQDRITIKLNSNGAYTSSYKIIGVNEEYVSNVSDGTEIELRGGAYKVIAWNSNEQGVRSDIVTTTVKIDEVHKFRTSFDSGNLYLREYMGEVNEDLDLVIPAYYYGYPVYSVGSEFAEDDDSYSLNRKKLLITNQRLSLVYINILGDNLYDADLDSFTNFSIINSLTIEEGIKEIGGSAFATMKVKTGNLIIPDSVESVGTTSFAWHVNLNENTYVHIGSGVKYIGLAAFGITKTAQDLIIPENVEYIGDEAFASMDIRANVIFETTKLSEVSPHLFGGSVISGNLILSSSITEVGNDAFYGLIVNGNIEFGNSNFKVKPYAFDNVIVFGDIKLGNVETIEEHAFQYASVRGNIDLGNNLKYLGTGAFYGVTMEKGNIVIPGSLESIGSYAFQNFMAPNSNLVLNEGLVNIQPSAFQGSIFAGDLVIPNSVVVIQSSAFSKAKFNGTLTLGNSVVTIGDMAFYSNGFTGGLEIPTSVTAIGNSAFMYNQFNGELITNHTLTNIGVNAFSYNPNLYGKVSVESGTPNDAFYNTKVEVTVV